MLFSGNVLSITCAGEAGILKSQTPLPRNRVVFAALSSAGCPVVMRRVFLLLLILVGCQKTMFEPTTQFNHVPGTDFNSHIPLMKFPMTSTIGVTGKIACQDVVLTSLG